MSKKKKKRSKKAAAPAKTVEETAVEEEPEEAADDEAEDEEEAEDDGDDEAEAASTPEPEAHDHAAHAGGHHDHAPNRKEYWKIFGALAVLTVLEVGIAYLEHVIGKTALVVALVGLALAKAGLVAIFFMHLKHETKVMKWTVMIPMAFPALYAFILIAEGMYRSIWGGV